MYSKSGPVTRGRSRRGTSLVELSLVVTILFLLTLGTIEYGWLFLKQQQLVAAAREGARIAATASSTNSQVTTQISTMMSTYGLASSGYTTTLNPSNVAAATTGQSLSVMVSVPYSNIGITHFTLLPVPTTLSATVTMYKEGP